MKTNDLRLIVTVILIMTGPVIAAQPIQLARQPALSHDGQLLAFSWNDDIWIVDSQGGQARQVTTAASRESHPIFAPHSQQLALVSDRTGSDQAYIIDLAEGTPRQVTFHSEGCVTVAWFPDGHSLLVSGARDHMWRAATRFFRIDLQQRSAERLLFDDYGGEGQLSHDGHQLLFAREGERWWRKGYHGSRASQIWQFDLSSREFKQLIKLETESRSPLWKPDQTGFYYVGGQSGSLNLWERDFGSGEDKQLTSFDDDSVYEPCISRDGSTIVFRHLFDFYRYDPHADRPPQRLAITCERDDAREPVRRTNLESATEVAFSSDGLEMAFVAGGDLWVMDTEFREPVQVTKTPGPESSPVFSPDGETILFVSDVDGQSDIWSARRSDEKVYWWQNESFELRQLTRDAESEYDLQWSPAGDTVCYVRERGDLWLMNPDGSQPRRLLKSWNSPQYDWSPDGKWIVYAVDDADFNRDVHIVPQDGSQQPFNLSRHPDNEAEPVWSPDGKTIAFVGRRMGDEQDIYFVYLQAEDSQATQRDRKLKEAIEKIEKARKSKSDTPHDPEEPQREKGSGDTEQDDGDAKQDGDLPAGEDEKDKDNTPPKLPEVHIDFDDIHERIRRVSIPHTSEANLFWSHDAKKLAFVAEIDGKRGVYTISPPDELTPKLLAPHTGRQARWLKEKNRIVWLADDKPASLSSDGEATSYDFSVKQTFGIAARYEAIFDLCWRAMRDFFYDAQLNNRNWDDVRRKYRRVAHAAVDDQTLVEVVQMMLGELNASHLGFGMFDRPPRPRLNDWRPVTAHLGVRFDASYRGPGLRIRDVLPDGPADRVTSQLAVGELVLSIDGHNVDPGRDLTEILNGPVDRDIHLRVRDVNGEDRDVTLRPISYAQARALLYEKWIDHNQELVTKAWEDKLGYLHIRGMDMGSFYRFEHELYSAAAGKDGIVIDVRDNGGGFTTDHLLTVLTQPTHAITVPRGGDPGYPQDRTVYATWRKPIVVLCNQNSFSNAEIFSHAIKTLNRGKLVGVRTAGGVISTGSVNIMNVGFLRRPFRGWFVSGTGQDMELNGAIPDYEIWPQPEELPTGIDRQLDKAIEVLKDQVMQWQAKPRPALQKNSQRP